MTIDIVEMTYDIGRHIVGGGGVTPRDLAPGEDNSVALIECEGRHGIFWSRGHRDEAVVVRA